MPTKGAIEMVTGALLLSLCACSHYVPAYPLWREKLLTGNLGRKRSSLLLQKLTPLRSVEASQAPNPNPGGLLLAQEQRNGGSSTIGSESGDTSSQGGAWDSPKPSIPTPMEGALAPPPLLATWWETVLWWPLCPGTLVKQSLPPHPGKKFLLSQIPLNLAVTPQRVTVVSEGKDSQIEGASNGVEEGARGPMEAAGSNLKCSQGVFPILNYLSGPPGWSAAGKPFWTTRSCWPCWTLPRLKPSQRLQQRP